MAADWRGFDLMYNIRGTTYDTFNVEKEGEALSVSLPAVQLRCKLKRTQ